MENKATQRYDYHDWANNRFLEHLKELPDQVYDQEIQSVFSTISEVIIHIYQVDAMWLSVMSSDSFDETMAKIEQIKERSADKGLDQMQMLYTKLAQQYRNFINGVDNPNGSITVEHPRYGVLETSVSELVQHVVNHGTYHRGNITAMLRQQERPGVPTDYVFYLYEIA